MANSKKGTAQVNPPTPKQRVETQFGSKAALVDKILALYDASEGSRSKLMQTANSKLTTHLHNTQRMAKEFGTRDGAITAILALRYPKGNAPEGEKTKLEKFSPWRLMDAHRQATTAKK